MIKKDGFYYLFDQEACSTCKALCCKERGFVFLSREDIDRISEYLQMEKERFLKLYTRKVLYGKKTALIDLKTKGELRCVFLNDDNRCEIYNVRPNQCREFPFWENLKQKSDLSKLCKGVVYADK